MTTASTRNRFQYIFFDNIKDSITGNEKIIKDEILTKLFSDDFSEGPSLELVKNGDLYVSITDTAIGPIRIPFYFCVKPGAPDMNPDYIFDSMNSSNYITLMSYYQDLTNIHTIITFNIEQHPTTNDYGVYIDALCVNNVAAYTGAKMLLNEFIDALRNIGISYVRLTSVPSQATIDFYNRNKFQVTGAVSAEGLIEYVRMIDENTNINPSTLASQIMTMKAPTPTGATSNAKASFVIRLRPMRNIRPSTQPDFAYGDEYKEEITRALRRDSKPKPKPKKGGRTRKGISRTSKTRKYKK